MESMLKPLVGKEIRVIVPVIPAKAGDATWSALDGALEGYDEHFVRLKSEDQTRIIPFTAIRYIYP